MTAKQVARGAAWIGGLSLLATGAWAFAAPRSFFDTVATYAPYNRHLFHDLGAFQLGLAAALLAGLRGRGGLAVGLWGGAVGSIVHAAAHWMDRDLGGRATDPLLLSLFAVLLVAGLVAAERSP